MKRLRDFKVKSSVHGELLLSDGHVICNKRTCNNAYRLGNLDIFKAKYNKYYKKHFIEVGDYGNKYFCPEFISAKPGLYHGKFKIQSAYKVGRGADKMTIIDIDTGAEYMCEMCGVKNIITAIADKCVSIYIENGDYILEGDCYFRYAGSRMFIEFLSKATKLQENYNIKQAKELKEHSITPAKLKPWHKYTKRLKYGSYTLLVCPYYSQYTGHSFHISPTYKHRKKDNMFLMHFVEYSDDSTAFRNNGFTGHFYDEEYLGEEKVKDLLRRARNYSFYDVNGNLFDK